jgi:hypothetical protein
MICLTPFGHTNVPDDVNVTGEPFSVVIFS